MLRAHRRASVRALLPVLLTAISVLVTAGPASASSSGDMVSYTNSARSNHGLSSLAVAGDLSQLAQQHAEWMASHHSLEHTSDLGGKVCCWKTVGENVGYGGTARQIFNAFMGSSEHRANILSGRYTQIGVGAARASNGYLYIDQIFRQPSGSTPSSTTGTSSPSRATRSSTRTPLHWSTAPRSTAPSAWRVRQAQLALRVSRLRPALSADPIRRGVLWVSAMTRVTAAR